MTTSKMRIGDICAMISNINNIQVALDTAAGAALMVELRMRLLGEHSQPVRDKLIDLVAVIKKNKPKKKHISDNYWNCDLSLLDDAIVEVFKNQLDNVELLKLDGFRKLRNKLLHADFVGLMEELGIPQTGRQILDPMNDKRNLLTSANIKESVLSVSSPRTKGLQTVEREAKEAILILDKLIYSLAIPG